MLRKAYPAINSNAYYRKPAFHCTGARPFGWFFTGSSQAKGLAKGPQTRDSTTVTHGTHYRGAFEHKLFCPVFYSVGLGLWAAGVLAQSSTKRTHHCRSPEMSTLQPLVCSIVRWPKNTKSELAYVGHKSCRLRPRLSPRTRKP